MKPLIGSLSALAVALVLIFALALPAHAQVLPPSRGGTGTSTNPTLGQVLLGQSNGTYAPVATTSLGIIANISAAYPLQYANGLVSLLFGTTTANSWGAHNIFTSLFATNASSTNATTTNLAVTGSFDFLGTTITNVATWFNGLFDARLAAKTTTDLAEGTNLYYTLNRVAAAIAGTTTDALAEGSSNRYFTDARARSSISETITGIDYSSGTGVFSLASGYDIPLAASTSEWATAYGWGNHALAGYLTSVSTSTVRGMFSAGSGLLYSAVTGIFELDATGDWTGTFDGREGTGYLARANHTGTQLLSTISDAGLLAALDDLSTFDTGDLVEGANLYFTNDRADARISAQKGQADGIASLDGGGKVPVSQLPNAIMVYQGTWNANTNTPTLADGVGSTGDVYRVSVAGTQDLGSGAISFVVGDYAIYNGSTWEKADTTDAVSSVNGFTGDVDLDTADIPEGSNLYYTLARWASALAGTTTDALTEGSTNRYYTDARARSALSVSGSGLSYDSGTGVFSVASSYSIPLTASTTEWNTFYTTPSNRITAGTGIDWSANTLNVTLADFTTTNLAEGTNLYYTDARVGSYITGSSTLPALLNYWTKSGSSISYTAGDVVIGSLTGFLKGSSGTVSAVSSLVPGDISLTKGNFLVGNDAGVAQATSSIFVSSTGNVGIGTTNPLAALTVGGTQAGNAGMEIVPGSGIVLQSYNRTAGAYASISYDGSSMNFRPNGTSKLFVDSTGVGIATTSPHTTLTVNGDGYFAGKLTATSTATSTFSGGIQAATGYVSSLFEAVSGIFTSLLRIPYSAALSLVSNGDIGIDSTSNQFQYRSNSATHVLSPVEDGALMLATSTLGTGTTTRKFPGVPQATTFTSFGCNGTGGGTFVAQIGDGSASTTAVVSATGNTTTFTTLSSNNSFSIGEAIYWAVGSVSGTVSNPSCAYGRTKNAT